RAASAGRHRPAAPYRHRCPLENGMSGKPAHVGERHELDGGMSVLVTGITELVTNDPAAGDASPLGVLRDAALVIESGRVAWTGLATAAPAADERRDLGGRAVVPGFVDSHTHLV